MTFDASAPLPGPPEPWAETDMPSRRDGPPWHMTEMIEAEPALAARILERLAADGSAAELAGLVARHAQAGGAITVVGCGTSEHGAQAVAEILAAELVTAGGDHGARIAARGPVALPAFEALHDPGFAPGSSSLVIGISHEGATWATMEALRRAVRAGATTALVTVSRRSPAAAIVDVVLETGELDQSWCHTVGYLSPIVAGLAVAAALRSTPARDGLRVEARGAREVLEAGLASVVVAAAEGVASRLAGCDRVVVIGSGADRVAARELTLKVEEGTHLPAAMRDTETLLHGHLAGMDVRTGLVAIGADPTASGPRAARLRQALRAAAAIGIRSAGILASGFDADAPIHAELLPAGRIDVPPAASVGTALLATAIPLQLLTERIARERGVDPDPIRRNDPRYLAAAAAAEAATLED